MDKIKLSKDRVFQPEIRLAKDIEIKIFSFGYRCMIEPEWHVDTERGSKAKFISKFSKEQIDLLNSIKANIILLNNSIYEE